MLTLAGLPGPRGTRSAGAVPERVAPGLQAGQRVPPVRGRHREHAVVLTTGTGPLATTHAPVSGFPPAPSTTPVMAPTPRADGADGTECTIAVTFERMVTECPVLAAEMLAWAGAEISTVASAVPKIVNVLAARKGFNRNRM